MKTSDLMIGDFIENSHTPLKVGSLTSSGRVRVQAEDAEYEKIDSYNPIMLSRDMLLSNGFKMDDKTGDYVWHDDIHNEEQVYVAMRVRRDGGIRMIDVHNHRCTYFNDSLPYGLSVHDFQHILRVCGFNDFADKIHLKLLF